MTERNNHGNGEARYRVTRTIVAATVAVLLGAAACGAPQSEADIESPGIGSVVVTQWNDSTELFLEYPHVVAGQPTGNWAIHLTDMSAFEPIRSGLLNVRFFSGASLAESFTVEGPDRDGLFLLDPVISAPGRYRVELELGSPQAHSLHTLADVQVYPTVADAPLAEESEEGGISFLKEQQWQIPWSVEPASTGAVSEASTVPGEVVAPDGALVQVGAPVAGIALEEPNRRAPSVGQRVTEGQVLVVLAPIAQEGGFARAVASVERLEREVRRAEQLFQAGAIPERRLEEARHDLEVARTEAEAMGASADQRGYLLELTAPMPGVVATRSFVPGGRVEAGTPLFTIVDPSAAWLRLSVPGNLASSIPDGAIARYRPEGSEEVIRTGRLVSIGRIMDPRTRTVPVVFDISAADRRFVYGQLAEAYVPAGAEETGIVISRGAIVDDGGTEVAYVQVGGETFEWRILVLGAGDGARTIVRSGIAPGEMVVVNGAYQVRLASMSGGEFAGGHTH